ncbi:MAG: NUDIX domain-containing protein [Campylobacterota bacterium]|nr:NUDIX domain-containing protein [Campylobacterota bacterium]
MERSINRELKLKAYGICLYKKNQYGTYILLCLSSKSLQKWGFVKGVQEGAETNQETAIREFYEESSILIDEKYLGNYFHQINISKDIGVYLVDYDAVSCLDKYFINHELKSIYLSQENTDIKFFDIKRLPKIKKKQSILVRQIVNSLEDL